MTNPSKVTTIATSVAGSAAVGNAIFNDGESRQDKMGAIVILYLLFGGIYGTYLYLKNLGIRAEQGKNVAAHILLPILATIGGLGFYVGWLYAVPQLRIAMGWGTGFWMSMFIFILPLVIWGIFASWCFDKLQEMNDTAEAGQVLQSKFAAFWMLCGAVLFYGAIIVFSI